MRSYESVTVRDGYLRLRGWIVLLGEREMVLKLLLPTFTHLLHTAKSNGAFVFFAAEGHRLILGIKKELLSYRCQLR